MSCNERKRYFRSQPEQKIETIYHNYNNDTKYVRSVSITTMDTVISSKGKILTEFAFPFLHLSINWHRQRYMKVVGFLSCEALILHFPQCHLSVHTHTNTHWLSLPTRSGHESLCPFSPICFNGSPDDLLLSSVFSVFDL